MTFLTPIPAIIAAAISVPLLLLLYFLKLRRRPVRVSSTLLWSDAVRDLQVNVPFRWIRPSWLLVLQLLILACFLLALARPAIDLDAPPASRIVVLIDRSASMSAADAGEGGTRLEAAKQRAVATLENLMGSGTTARAAVVAFAAEPVALTSFTADRGALASTIRTIEPTDQPGDLQSALQLAGALLTSGQEVTEEAAPEPGLVVLFSDGSFEADEAFTLAGADFRFERIGPVGGAADNLGIVAIAARRDYEDPGLVRIFVRLVNTNPRAVAVPLTLSFDGELSSSKAVTVPGATRAAAPGEGAPAAPAADAPGQLATTFELRQRSSGVATVRIERQDVLAADNTASLVLSAAARPRVLVVVPDPPAGSPLEAATESAWRLTDVLREMDLLSLRVVPASVYEASVGQLDAYDLVIFDRVRPNAAPPLPTLSFGTGLPIPGVSVSPAEPAEPRGTYFLSWQRSHPVLRDVALDQVFVARPLSIRTAEPEGDSPAAAVVELARGRDGPLILLAEHGRIRRLVVGFDLAQSNWWTHIGFPIFLAEAVDYLTLRGEDHAGRAFSTTEPAEIDLGSDTSRVVLRGPNEIVLPERDLTESRLSGGRAALGVIDRAGVYQAPSGPDGLPRAIAVNLLSEHESGVGVADQLRVSGTTVQGAAAGQGPREIWHWFVLGAAVLLILEWFLHAWFMRV